MRSINFLSDFYEPWNFWTDFQKILKFHEDLPSGSQLYRRGRTDMADMAKPVVNFRSLRSRLRKVA